MNTWNDNVSCFLWSITAHLYRASKYEDVDRIYKESRSVCNLEGIEFPAKIAGTPPQKKRDNKGI